MKSAALASVRRVRRDAAVAGLKPPPRLTLSAWADEYFRLSTETAAVPGRWKTLPYQVEIMDAMSDPAIPDVTVMKSARIGYTLMITAAVGYYVHQAPCSILFAQPRVEDAKEFSKDTIAPMIRDVPVLAAIMEDASESSGPKDSGDTIQAKRYPGGRLRLTGANSGAGFRRLSCRVFVGDEIDAWPASAGSDGDPVSLGKKRTEYFWNRKHILGSTGLIQGRSRIEAAFLAGDQRRFHVPCPHCGHFDYLVFSKKDGGPGHCLKWDEGDPEGAYFVCSLNGCVIEHKDKRDMIERGRWIAAQPFKGHASFHVWAAYSYSPGATWGQIAIEFIAARAGGRDTLQTFINTVLGETWKEAGDAPDWEPLYQRREHYAIGSVPAGVEWLTAGVDVQKDRFVYEVVGWNRNRETWSIDAGVIPADTSNEAEWVKLDALLDREFPGAVGAFTVRMLGVDSGFNTQMVYLWARRHVGRVVAVKGVAAARTFLGAPTDVDISHNGKRITRGCKVWPLGVDIAKTELHGWLRLQAPLELTLPHPFGFCHFPQLGEDFFKQLTGEHLVTVISRKGFKVTEWQVVPGRENHWLDARVYARAAVAVLGLDRVAPPVAVVLPAVPPVPGAPPVSGAAPAARAAAPVKPKRQIPDSSFWSGRVTRKGFLKR